MSRERLFELAAQADEQLNEFYAPVAGATQEEEDRRRGTSVPRMAVRGGALAAGVAGAAYGGKQLRNAVINRAGVVDDFGNMVARRGMYGDAAKSYGKAAMEGGKGAARKGLKFTGRKIAKMGAEGGMMRGIGSKLLKASRAFEVEQLDRIVELAARIEEMEMREFGSTLNRVQKRLEPKDEKERAAYHDKWNNRRKGAAAGVAGTAGLIGAEALLSNRGNARGLLKKGLANVKYKMPRMMKPKFGGYIG